MVYLDTATAQTQLLAKPGMFSAVTVDAAPGTTDTDLRQRLQAALGPGYAISIKEEQAQSSAAQISAFLTVVTDALLGFAGIAVVVGIFLILNTFSMLVAARTRELGLLRALGASRRQVTGMVLVEGLLLGLLGATARPRRRNAPLPPLPAGAAAAAGPALTHEARCAAAGRSLRS